MEDHSSNLTSRLPAPGLVLSPGVDVAAVDVETTGREPGRDRVISIGVCQVIDRRPGVPWTTLVQPEDVGKLMQADASAVHGLTAGDLTDAPRFRAIVTDFAEQVGQLPIIAHYAAFDLAFITAELRRIGITSLPWIDPARWCDTYALSRTRFATGRHGLDYLARRFGIPARQVGGHHDAGEDAQLLARCWAAWDAANEATQGDLFGAIEAEPESEGDPDSGAGGTHAEVVAIPIHPFPASPDAQLRHSEWVNANGYGESRERT